jgi:hypothetical protein
MLLNNNDFDLLSFAKTINDFELIAKRKAPICSLVLF